MDTQKVGSGISGALNSSRMNNVSQEEAEKLKDLQNKDIKKQGSFDVDFSDQGKVRSAELAKAMEIARNTSAIRQDRVDELKARIQAGNYQIDSGKIADGMLREAIKDRISTDL